jgi:hypothetical protein
MWSTQPTKILNVHLDNGIYEGLRSKSPILEISGKRILSYESEEFRTISNLPFTYEINGTSLCPSRTKHSISKLDFAKTYELVPIRGAGEISKIENRRISEMDSFFKIQRPKIIHFFLISYAQRVKKCRLKRF